MTEVGCRANVAVTAGAVESDTEQVPVPEQPPPLHPEKVEPAAAPPERVTIVPPGKVAEHIDPQLIPAGALMTVPSPVPALATVSESGCNAKVAVTEAAAERDTEQVPVPEQLPPLQPEKVKPEAELADSVTLVLMGKLVEQVPPQLIPAGELVTVPEPALLMVSATDCKEKVAMTVVVALRVTEQVPVPEQPPPLHPENVDPATAFAARAIEVPAG
jgi:hypothetical protein